MGMISDVLGRWKSFPAENDYENSGTSFDDIEKQVELMHEKIDLWSTKTDLLTFWELVFYFEKTSSDYYDTDIVFRQAIEGMDNYPPVELFETPVDNTVIQDLRSRCLAFGIVKSSPKINVFVNNFLKFYGKDVTEPYSKALENIFNANVLLSMNEQELKLAQEVTQLFPKYSSCDLEQALTQRLKQKLSSQYDKTGDK